MKNVFYIVILTRHNNSIDGRYGIGAKTIQEAEKILRDYLRQKNINRKISAYYINHNKQIGYKKIVNEIEKNY